jgi:hypothetical protein
MLLFLRTHIMEFTMAFFNHIKLRTRLYSIAKKGFCHPVTMQTAYEMYGSSTY